MTSLARKSQKLFILVWTKTKQNRELCCIIKTRINIWGCVQLPEGFYENKKDIISHIHRERKKQTNKKKTRYIFSWTRISSGRLICSLRSNRSTVVFLRVRLCPPFFNTFHSEFLPCQKKKKKKTTSHCTYIKLSFKPAIIS